MEKILVVDDEQDILHLVKKCLENTGKYEVITTSIPEDVEKICRDEQPDLILLDIVMPNFSGNDIIQCLRSHEETKDILIVVSSGMGEMVYREKKDEWKWEPNRPMDEVKGETHKERTAEETAARYGADDFLAKPFSARTLLLVIKEVFQKANSGKKQQDENS